MDLNEAKKLVNCQGEKVVLVEDGNPTMVLLSYEDYRKLSSNGGEDSQQKIFDVPSESPVEAQQDSEGELTLEDLPF